MKIFWNQTSPIRRKLRNCVRLHLKHSPRRETRWKKNMSTNTLYLKFNLETTTLRGSNYTFQPFGQKMLQYLVNKQSS